MIVGRSIVGAAVGAASFVVPMYVGELAPSYMRGRMVVVLSLFITGGQVVAYLVGWGFSAAPRGWRWMVGLGAVPACVQVALMLGMPESPRFLVMRGRREKARKILKRVYGDERVGEEVLRRVEREILEEEEVRSLSAGGDGGAKSGWKAKFAGVTQTYTQLVGVGGNRRALIIACMLQGLQQLCGFVSFPTPALSSRTCCPNSTIFFTSFRSCEYS